MKKRTVLIATASLILVCMCIAIANSGKKDSTTATATPAPIATTVKQAAQATTVAQPTNTPPQIATIAKLTNTVAPTIAPAPTAPPLPSNTPRPVATATPAVPGFGAGMKIVGTDMLPGTYRSTGGSGCYWERLSGFGGTLGEILSNENASGPAVVTIAATDKGFNSARCGSWTQALTPITSSPTAPFGDGTFMVNKDIAPGTWRSSGSGSCYWVRLRGFSGAMADIIANVNITGSTVVTIGAGDVGFSSARCGTWTKAD